MSATESERHQLYETAKHEVSDRFAELLITNMPPHPDQLATKDDMAGLRVDMAELRTDLKTDMAQLRTDLKTDMAQLRTDLKTDMAQLRTELKTEITELRTEMAGLRGELRTEMRDLTISQTRTLMLGLVGSITALTVTELLVGRFG